MTSDLALSRPLRLATLISGRSPEEAYGMLEAAVVRVRLAPRYADAPDAAILVRSLVDQLSRFCGTVVVSAPSPIVESCVERDHHLHDPPRVQDGRPLRGARVLEVLVGDPATGHGDIVTCSDGWVGRVSAVGSHVVVPAFAAANPLGALVAAALTAGEVFLRIIVAGPTPSAVDLSAWTGESGPLGSLAPGPYLPIPPAIDCLLAGCGNVMNGWGVAAHALGLIGKARAIDRQSLQEENLGPYALARSDMLGEPKTALLAQYLEPQITVTRHDEELDLFVPRVTQWGLALPDLVITGLDDVPPRHLVQRLWPATLVDMAAGGTTSQVIVYRRGRTGQCLLGAFSAPDADIAYARRIEALTGLRSSRFLTDFTSEITADDVACAPPEHRAQLQAAADAGELVCGYINRASLGATDQGDFAAAAPFVGALTGARAAAITVGILHSSDISSGQHWQYSFLSHRARSTVMRCVPGCECQRIVEAC